MPLGNGKVSFLIKKINSGFREEPFESRKYLTILESRDWMVIGSLPLWAGVGFGVALSSGWVGWVEGEDLGS